MKRRARLSLSQPQADIGKQPEGFSTNSPPSSSRRQDVGKEQPAKPREPFLPHIAPDGEAQQQLPTGALPLNGSDSDNKVPQGIATDEFFYFFLRMRKGEVRRIVALLQTRYPEEGPEQLSKRLIASKSRLALLGGALVSLPWLLPGVGQSLKLAGIVGATSVLTRMNLYLINEIALVFGEDIDDAARVSDMVAVVGATALSTAAPGVIGQSLGLNPWFQLPAGALSSAAMTQLIGQAAIRHFRGRTMDQRDVRERLATPDSA